MSGLPLFRQQLSLRSRTSLIKRINEIAGCDGVPSSQWLLIIYDTPGCCNCRDKYMFRGLFTSEHNASASLRGSLAYAKIEIPRNESDRRRNSLQPPPARGRDFVEASSDRAPILFRDSSVRCLYEEKQPNRIIISSGVGGLPSSERARFILDLSSPDPFLRQSINKTRGA